MRRVFLILTVIIGSAVTAAEAAQPPQRFKLEPNELTLTGACSFDVHYSEVRVHGNYLVFLDAQGEVTREIVAGNFVTIVTNIATGASLTLNISGQFFITPNPDGSLTYAAHGRNLLYTVEPEPILIFHRGEADFTFTPTADSFEIVLHELRGGGFDVCEALGGTA